MIMKSQHKERANAKSKHCSYFQHLENKLLEQTDTLTNLIDKSHIQQSTHRTLKSNLSTCTSYLHSAQLNKSNHSGSQVRLSTKTEVKKSSKNYLERAKAIVQKLKKCKEENAAEPGKNFVSGKEKYEKMRNAVYGLEDVKNNNKQQFARNQGAKSQDEDTEDKSKKSSFKSISDHPSLKDTMSTQVSKNLHFIQQNMSPFFSNDKLDDFQALSLLGSGKLGQVCMVRHKKTGYVFALKEIAQARLCTDSKMLLQRIRQIKIQCYLDHPNIVQLYSAFIQDNNLYLLMELCWGGNLYQHLKYGGPMPEDKIRSIIKQVCYAVEYMHDNDIIHRDLKPENILFHEDIIKICDFGWAVYSPLLRNTLCGTPLYSSPQVVQKQNYDNKIDVWNIGILTYELLLGKVPFEIRHESETIKVVEEEIHFPRSQPTSYQIKDFIMHCLNKNPKDRYSISKLLDHEFLSPRDLTQSV